MRIGIFTETYTPYISGLVTSEIMLKKGLEKLGHEVYVVTANLESFHYEYDEEEHILRIPGIPTGIYDSRLTAVYPLKAVNIIKNWNLDIIHSQTEFAMGTFARLMAYQLDIPLVHTYHTMYEDYVHYVTKGYFDRSSKKLVEYLTKFYCDKTAQELIVPSKKTYDLFKEKYKVDKPIHIVPTGIDVERFYKEKLDNKILKELKTELGIKTNEKVILFVGRLAKEKNIEFLIENHISICKKNKCKLMIVGDGPDYDHYIDLIKKNHLESSVIVTGSVPWTEIPYYYGIADIFVTASTTETQGLTIIEAMAASLPVVCIDDESFNTVIINGLNGNLFTDKKSYQKSITTLLNNSSKLDIMSKQARITADSHSLKYYAEKILDVYRFALKEEKTNNIWDKIKNVIKKGKI